MKEFILINRVPVGYGQTEAKEVAAAWTQLTDEWKQAAAAMSDEFLRSMPPDGQDYRLRYLQRAVYLIVQENEPLHVYRLNTIAYLAMPSQT